MIYVVLGMHKSGTTLVSQILHHSGINMGESISADVNYDQGNKYERQATLQLNQEILSGTGVNSIDLTAPTGLQLSNNQRRQMMTIIGQLDKKYSDWGFKDPRTCLTYPLWASELPEHRLIVVYRSLDELWQRYRYIENPRARYRDLSVAWKLVQRWHEYTANIIATLEQTSMEFVVLEYQRLMSTQAEFDRLQNFVGRPLTDMRRTDLYRHRQPPASLPLQISKWRLQRRGQTHPDALARQLAHFRQARPAELTNRMAPVT
ncbi:MAG: hypothetical protein D6768_10500 [Chloroflexi bacterium]|nr:MAG: hypothetical protein D6768_10500 [Chloroflexota bacterium]